MRNSIFLPAILLFAAPGFSQSGGKTLDAMGNYVPSYVSPHLGTAGPDAPGDLLRSFSLSNQLPVQGYAPRNEGGFYANASGGNAEMYAYDRTGLLIGSFLVTDTNDTVPGYDGSRETVACTNAFDDTISGYDPFTGAPRFRVPTPTLGPVGCTYDSTRDLYWYADWTTNELIGLDASDLHAGTATVVDRFGTATQLTRIIGVAYNCLDDTLTTGGRDQHAQVAYNVASKQVAAFWPTLGFSINDPQGCGLSGSSGIYTNDFLELAVREHEGSAGNRPELVRFGSLATTLQLNLYFGLSGARAIFGSSQTASRQIIKGVQTCLGLPAGKLGVANFSGGSAQITFPNMPGPIYFQAATLPQKLVSNLICSQ